MERVITVTITVKEDNSSMSEVYDYVHHFEMDGDSSDMTIGKLDDIMTAMEHTQESIGNETFDWMGDLTKKEVE